jgi:hypothetical protein
MAVFSSILVPANEAAIQILAQAASTSSAEIVLGPNRIFAINSDRDITVKFGNAGMAAATGVEYRIPANQQTTFDVGSQLNSLRIWNTGNVNGTAGTPTTSNTYILLLSRT